MQFFEELNVYPVEMIMASSLIDLDKACKVQDMKTRDTLVLMVRDEDIIKARNHINQDNLISDLKYLSKVSTMRYLSKLNVYVTSDIKAQLPHMCVYHLEYELTNLT